MVVRKKNYAIFFSQISADKERRFSRIYQLTIKILSQIKRKVVGKLYQRYSANSFANLCEKEKYKFREKIILTHFKNKICAICGIFFLKRMMNSEHGITKEEVKTLNFIIRNSTFNVRYSFNCLTFGASFRV